MKRIGICLIFILLCASFSAKAQNKDTVRVLSADELLWMYNSLVSKVDSMHRRAVEDSIVIARYLEQARIAALAAQPAPKRPSFWTNTLISQLNFSQIALSNWAAGGNSSIAMNAYMDFRANYAKKKSIFENRVQLGYGFINAFGDIYKKSDDKIVIDSKWGYQAVKTLYVSASLNAKTQMTPGFKYTKADTLMVSQFAGPANISLAIGLDYKPNKWFTLNYSPLTGGLVIVSKPSLRKIYGNDADEAVRVEFGQQLKVNIAKEIMKNVKVTSMLNLFSDYLDHPLNIQVTWDFTCDMTINKYLSANIRTNMIYNDNIKITDKDGRVGPRLQFKEVFGIGLSYTFKNK